jgi:hypothetical protein
VTLSDFSQKGLLIDVATAPTTSLALGKGPLLSTTLSFLSSRVKRADLRCATRVPRAHRPTTSTSHPERSASRIYRVDTVLDGAESKDPEGAYLTHAVWSFRPPKPETGSAAGFPLPPDFDAVIEALSP